MSEAVNIRPRLFRCVATEEEACNAWSGIVNALGRQVEVQKINGMRRGNKSVLSRLIVSLSVSESSHLSAVRRVLSTLAPVAYETFISPPAQTT